MEFYINGGLVLIDDEDFELVSGIEWENIGGYAMAISPGMRGMRMHRLILNSVSGEEVDHRNHDGLDNRKINLRKCRRHENAKNRIKQDGTSSQYKGVSKCNNCDRWVAQIMVNGDLKYLGLYKTEKKAAFAYNLYSKKYHGDFGYLNNIRL